MFFRPFFHLLPTFAHLNLARSGDAGVGEGSGARSVVGIAEDLPAESVETVKDVVMGAGLGERKAVFVKGEGKDFLDGC